MPIEKEQTKRKEENKVQILRDERRVEKVENIEDEIMRLTGEVFEEYKENDIEMPAEKAAELKEIVSMLRKEEFAPFRDELQKTYFFEKIFSIHDDGYVDVLTDNINNDLFKFRVASICGEDDFNMVEAAKVLNSYAAKPIGSHILDFKKGMLPIAKELYLEARNTEIDDEEFRNAKRIVREWLLLRDKGFAEKEEQRKEQDEEGMLRARLKSAELLLSRPRTEEDIRKELLELKEEKEELWRNFIEEGFESAERNSMRVEICDSHFSSLREELDLLPARQKMEKLSRNFRTEEERDAIYSAHAMLLKAKQLRDGVSRKMNRNNFESLLKIIERPLDEDEEEYEFLENMRNYIEGIKNGRIRAFLSELREARELEARAEEEYSNVRIEKNYKNKTNKREVK